MNFRISVKSFIVDENNKLLILKRTNDDVHKPGIWEIPGGRLELGEDPVKGLIRETKEETGIDVDVLNPLVTKHFTREDSQVITMIVYLCKPITKLVKLSKEHIEHEWADLNQAKSKLNDFFHGEIDNYKHYFSD